MLKLLGSLFAARIVLIAENLFLRKELALFQERKIKPRRASKTTKLMLVALSRLFDWKSALVIVKPDTFVRWHRQAFRLFWRWKSRGAGRPKLPRSIRELIREIVRDNPTWGQERITNELSLKLGILVSPRTVAKYMDRGRRPGGPSSQHWSAFVRYHAQVIVACDFFTSVTASFRVLYVFVAMEVGSRRILHFNITTHPTADWTLQQFREVLPGDYNYRFVIHDRDAIFAPSLDASLLGFGVLVLKTPVRTPTANAFCERLVGTIPPRLSGLPHPALRKPIGAVLTCSAVPSCGELQRRSSLGPGIPEPSHTKVPDGVHRHRLPDGYQVARKPILGGLHHEYGLEKKAA